MVIRKVVVLLVLVCVLLIIFLFCKLWGSESVWIGVVNLNFWLLMFCCKEELSCSFLKWSVGWVFLFFVFVIFLYSFLFLMIVRFCSIVVFCVLSILLFWFLVYCFWCYINSWLLVGIVILLIRFNLDCFVSFWIVLKLCIFWWGFCCFNYRLKLVLLGEVNWLLYLKGL